MRDSSWWGSLNFLPSWKGALLGTLMDLLTFLLLDPYVICIPTQFLTKYFEAVHQLLLKVKSSYQQFESEETEE